jgi:hypothetical protein
MRYSMCRGCVRQVVVYRGVREESNQSFQSPNKQICIRSLKIVRIKSKDRQRIYHAIFRPLYLAYDRVRLTYLIVTVAGTRTATRNS